MLHRFALLVRLVVGLAGEDLSIRQRYPGLRIGGEVEDAIALDLLHQNQVCPDDEADGAKTWRASDEQVGAGRGNRQRDLAGARLVSPIVGRLKARGSQRRKRRHRGRLSHRIAVQVRRPLRDRLAETFGQLRGIAGQCRRVRQRERGIVEPFGLDDPALQRHAHDLEAHLWNIAGGELNCCGLAGIERSRCGERERLALQRRERAAGIRDPLARRARRDQGTILLRGGGEPAVLFENPAEQKLRLVVDRVVGIFANDPAEEVQRIPLLVGKRNGNRLVPIVADRELGAHGGLVVAEPEGFVEERHGSRMRRGMLARPVRPCVDLAPLDARRIQLADVKEEVEHLFRRLPVEANMARPARY